jgi:hypothetical protein
MSEILTWEQITQRFQGEWLLIIEAELDEQMGIIRGQVLAHSRKQDDIYNTLPLRQGRSASIEYVGEVPEDLAFNPFMDALTYPSRMGQERIDSLNPA